MNRSELQLVLDEKGIRPRSYSLTGGSPSESYCIERSNGGWAVYYAERGNRNSEKWFVSEDEACDHLLQWILGDPTTHTRPT